MALTIVSDPHVRSYELTYLVSPEATDADVQTIKDDFSKLVKKQGGEVTTVEDWGKKYLAYDITHEGKTHREAIYVHTVLTMPALNAPKLDREVQLDIRVIRHLFVVAEKVSQKAAKANDTIKEEAGS